MQTVVKKEYNMTFGILSAMAILMIVAGHVSYNIFTVGDLFPYYSFHVPLFMFISGYFYRDESEAHPFAYLKKKVWRLLVPYMIWNLFYGVLAYLLRTFGDFAFGDPLSVKSLLIAPFTSGYQFSYNYAAWFVPTLFIVEIMNLVMRFVMRKMHLNYEWLYLILSLALGMATAYLAIGGHVWGPYKTPGRILFLYPCFQMGQFYHQKLEKRDTLPNIPYFAIVIGIQLILQLVCHGQLAYTAVWCTGFAHGPVVPYLTVITGTAFFLRIAKILTPVLEKSRSVNYLARNTYAVMMHHVFTFILVKAVIGMIAKATGTMQDFDWVLYHGNIDYYYLVNGVEQFKMVYLLAGVLIPLGMQRIVDACMGQLRKSRKSD